MATRTGAPQPSGASARAAEVAQALVADRTLPVGRAAIARDLPVGTADLIPGRTPQVDAAMDQLLATGQEVGQAWGVTHPSGDNMRLRVVPVRDAVSGARALAVEKPAFLPNAGEFLGVGVARELGIDYLVPAVGRRSDGRAFVERVPGIDLEQLRITRPRDLERLLTQRYRRMGMDGAEVAARARLDAELIGTFNFLLANDDAFERNIRFNPTRGVTLIDFGNTGFGGDLSSNPLAPVLAANSQPIFGPHADPARVVEHRLHEVRLSDVALDVLDTARPDALAKIHADVAALPEVADDVARHAEQIVREESFLDDVLLRLTSVLERGGYHFFAS